MTPLVDTFAIDRATHLFGAGGAHRPIVLEETQAAVLERQPAIVQQAADLGFGVVDHAFVDDAMDAAGQGRFAGCCQADRFRAHRKRRSAGPYTGQRQQGV